MQNQVWLIYDAQNSRQSRPIETQKAKAFCVHLPIEQRPLFFIWTPGWTHWKKVSEYLQESDCFKPSTQNQHANQKVNEPSAPTPNKSEPIKPAAQSEFHADHLSPNTITDIKPPQSEEGGIEKRGAVRYDFAIDVVISSSGKTFRSQTENISTSGVRLKDPIPAQMLRPPIEIVIVNKLETDPKKARILFHAKIVGNITDPRRLSFMDPHERSVKELEEMLARFGETPAKVS